MVAAALSGVSDPAAAAEAVLDGCRDPRDDVQRGLSVPVAQLLLDLGDACPPAVVAAAVWHPVTAAAAAAHPLATSDDKAAAQRAAAGLGRRSQRTQPRQCGRRTKDGSRCTVQAKRLVDGDWCGRCAGIPDTHHTLWSPAHLPDDYVPLAADAALHEGMRLPYAKAQAAAAGAPHSGWRRRLDELRSDPAPRCCARHSRPRNVRGGAANRRRVQFLVQRRHRCRCRGHRRLSGAGRDRRIFGGVAFRLDRVAWQHPHSDLS